MPGAGLNAYPGDNHQCINCGKLKILIRSGQIYIAFLYLFALMRWNALICSCQERFMEIFN